MDTINCDQLRRGLRYRLGAAAREGRQPLAAGSRSPGRPGVGGYGGAGSSDGSAVLFESRIGKETPVVVKEGLDLRAAARAADAHAAA